MFFSEVPYELGERKNNFILTFRQIHCIFLFRNVLVKYEKQGNLYTKYSR